MSNVIHDAPQRQQALDTSTSFIVQAPAGSGKTGLLTQRYLKLLSQVQAPEEIIAITFTKKAAAEMRGRILSALNSAVVHDTPDNPHEQLTWQLAKQALQQDARLNWNLLASPTRLRVMTIDSLSAWLAKQLPVVSQFGVYQQVSEAPDYLYQQAVHQALDHLNMETHWSGAFEKLIMHLDNNLGLVEGLLVSMLAKREQWLRHIPHGQNSPLLRDVLESALQQIVDEHLQRVADQLASTEFVLNTDVIRFAADNVDEQASIAACRDMEALPDARAEYMAQWLGIVDLLLTQNGDWRKQITIKQGFPAPSSVKNAAEKAHLTSMKARFSELLLTLRDDELLCQSLAAITTLPSAHYSESQWDILNALCELLPIVVAELYLVFAEHRSVDFTQVAKSAIEALGEEDNPTDLALILDYKIKHIMVDEFQDTSFGQFDLLQRLTHGWLQGDGRTLFLVGDPMQSIYRFREAEVGFFLKAREEGIGDLRLTPLTLSVNFRSQAGVVEWVNAVFQQVLPAQDNVAYGAVSYSPSHAFHAALEGDTVEVIPCYSNDAMQEAVALTSIVKKIKKTKPQDTIAIIVQARSHLKYIVEQLKAENVSYQAIDIDALAERVLIQDLSSLTRALLHIDDSVAWYALLRSPWCGLTLKELAALGYEVRGQNLWQCVADTGRYFDRVKEETRLRIRRFLDVMASALDMRGRCSLRVLIESTWLHLGGGACVFAQSELDDAQTYFHLLEELEKTDSVITWPMIALKLSRLYAQPDALADASVQMMTIHKSKGLEFDHVLLPGLGRRIVADDKRLLMWLEKPSNNAGGDLLLAPLNATGESSDSIYNYLRLIEQKKLDNESARLLYVAVTRAKKKIYLLGHVTVNDTEAGFEVRSPSRTTMLAKLWHAVESVYIKSAAPMASVESDNKVDISLPLFRLPAQWQMPNVENKFDTLSHYIPQAAGERIEYQWLAPTARHIGTLVHWLLMKAAQTQLQSCSKEQLQRVALACRTKLRQMGVPHDDLEVAAERVVAALENTLQDERGRWLLNNQHADAENEYAVSGVINGKCVRGVIDRTFVDDDGVRWIIDYKTSVAPSEDVERFLDDEMARYRRQLDTYATIFRGKNEFSIRLGLYFPLIRGWREWGN